MSNVATHALAQLELAYAAFQAHSLARVTKRDRAFIVSNMFEHRDVVAAPAGPAGSFDAGAAAAFHAYMSARTKVAHRTTYEPAPVAAAPAEAPAAEPLNEGRKNSTNPDGSPRRGWFDALCINAGNGCLLTKGRIYRLKEVRNGWFETECGARMAQFRFERIKAPRMVPQACQQQQGNAGSVVTVEIVQRGTLFVRSMVRAFDERDECLIPYDFGKSRSENLKAGRRAFAISMKGPAMVPQPCQQQQGKASPGRYRVNREKGCGRGLWDLQIARETGGGYVSLMTGRIGESPATKAEHAEMVRALNSVPTLLAALRGVMPYAESRLEDMEECAEACRDCPQTGAEAEANARKCRDAFQGAKDAIAEAEGAEVEPEAATLALDAIRATLLWRALWRDMDALEAEFGKPHYARRSDAEIIAEGVTLSNLLRDVRPHGDCVSEASLSEMLDGYSFVGR